jgi:PilZ domain
MSWPETPREKRHAMRVHPSGTAVLHRHDREHHGHIVDLAAGGVALDCTSTGEHVGDTVTLDIALERRHWNIRGHIVRIDDAATAVAFDDIPLELEDYVQDELLDLVEHAARSNVAITDLASVGAILALEDAFDVIALPDTVPESVVEELRELLLAEGARR